MSVAVLQSREEIAGARDALVALQASCLCPRWKRLLIRARLSNEVAVGDWMKSWDILQTVRYIAANRPPTASILDLGSYASELLPALSALGFQRLTGIDLNPANLRMPRHESIRYEVGDFLRSSLPDASFDVITAISVIEHGFEREALLGEVSRLLRSGGAFVFSTDYWPTKIDTAGVQAFGLDWRIFSIGEIEDLVACAAQCGLRVNGTPQYSAHASPITWKGRSYTFLWMALTKA